MRSRAEWAARLAVLTLVVWAGWRLWMARPADTGRLSDSEAAIQLQDGALTPRAVHLRLATDAPAPAVRDWLGGLARSGSTVSWSGAPRPLAMDAEPLREPAGGWQLRVAADGAVALRDTLGLLDSLDSGGSTVRLSSSPTRVSALQGGTRAQASGGTLDSLGRVLVLGRVGWESKFVIAALEEAGWRVSARLQLGGGRLVTQEPAVEWRAPQLAAVVLLDSVPESETASLTRYLRSGGGVLLSGSALDLPSLRALLPARPVGERPPATTPDLGADPRLSLGRALLEPRSDAVVTDAIGAVPLVFARRVDRGRLAQLSLRESWRWRMTGEGESLVDHRLWWTRLVGQVAASPVFRADPPTREGAPIARLVSALGASSAEPAAGSGTDGRLPAFILPVILGLLLAEWGSRRLRGSR